VVLQNRQTFKQWVRDERIVTGVVETQFYQDTRTLKMKVDNASETTMETKVETKVEVWPMDTFNSAWHMVKSGAKPAVLNMASDRCPGGGYKNGAMAQEEELFRRSTLSLSLEDYYGLQQNRQWSYPLKPYQMIYSPDVLVFRDTEDNDYQMFKKKDRCFVDIISAAAIRRPKISGNEYAEPVQREIMLEKIRGIFKVAADKGHQHLLLSAFGCGAFYNPPEAVALIFKQVLEEFEGQFQWVVFGIYDGPRSDNYGTFKRLLE
jgi:uncharacterized protein (TIGR02452 family)